MERSRGEDIYSGGFQLNSIIISDPDKARKIALTYLKDVKGTFPETSDKYTEFVDIMKDYKAQRADITGVLARVKELFKGYPKLILGFNTFLPKGCEIVLSQEDELEARKAVEFDEAMQFVQKIRIRFQGDDHVYKYFLDIMDIYRKETKFITKVHHEVAALLYNQPDLLNKFTNFLPNSSAEISNHYVHSNRTHKPHSEDRTSIIGSANPRCSENKYIACLADHDVSVGCHMGADMVDHYQENDHKIHGGKEKVKRKDRGQKHSQDKDFDNHGRNNVPRKHKSVNTLEDTVIELFHQDMREQVISLHEKVKARLQGLNDYQTFLKYIMHYRTQNITLPQLQALVNDLLGAYPDLIEEVNGFIDRSERDGSLWSGHLPGSFKSEDEERYKDHDRDEMIRYREITGSKIVSGSKRSLFPSNNEYQAKLFHELDLSECEQCTPSYRLLPKNYPIPSASQRTKIGAEVLNDHWVSVTSGSEDYSFKQMRKNQYEESLFRCEDDRFELDMLLESVNLTTRRVEELLNKINNNSIKTESVVRIEDHFTAFNLRCIERLYGDNRLDVMDVLRKNASLALPVILTRLKQKQEEWARCRFDFSKIWEENFAKNYHKSLDHRSFYFKQQDSKSLSTKALLAEIKEISEEKSKKENIYQHFASGERQNSTPHQEFKYCDLDIHDDIYQLMKYYIPQNFTIEQFNKVMKIWSNFVEPLFNVPIRHHLNAKNGRPIEDKNVHKGNTSVKEREEDDLSPNRDFEDDFATYGEIDTKKSYQNRYHGNGLDKVAYEEGEESAHRPYCDSVGPKEHDGFHDNKDESEGEAERFLETAKPLAKYTPAISHNEENDAQVFYGNDAFYVFFRLHQHTSKHANPLLGYWWGPMSFLVVASLIFSF